MLELLLTLTRNTLPNNQEFLATNDVGQPSAVSVNWCRGTGANADSIFVLAIPNGATTARVHFYVYSVLFNTWTDLGLTTTSLARLDWSPTLTARTANLLVYMALDTVYFYDIPSKVWTLKKAIGTGQSGYMYGTKGWLYSGEIWRYGASSDTFGNRTVTVQAYDSDTDTHRGVFTDNTHTAVANLYAPTILIGTKIYYFAISGVVSYYDLVARRIVYTTVSVPVAAYNTLVEYKGNILIFGDASSDTKVRLFNTSTNTVTLLSNPTLVSTARTFGVNLRENEINLYVGKRADPGVCNTLKYKV